MSQAQMVVSQVTEVVVRRAQPGLQEGPAAFFWVDFGEELKPERVQEWLVSRPEWRLSSSGKVLLRTRRFPEPAAAVHYGTFVSGLATAMGLPVIVKIWGSRVDLSLSSPRNQGRTSLTQRVFDLASQLG